MSAGNLQSFSLRAKLLVFVTVLVLVPGGMYGYIAVSSSRRALARVVGLQLVGEAHNAADRLATALRGDREGLEAFAHQDVMREIRIGDRTLFSSAQRIDLPARDRRIGYVPQDALLFPHMSVRGNIAFGSHSQDGLEPLLQILDVGGLLDRRVSKLSGGEKQRVAIARALMTRPSILLLDEPLAGVDRERREVILPYILRIRRELHVPLMYVTHDEAELRAIADRVLRLEKN